MQCSSSREIEEIMGVVGTDTIAAAAAAAEGGVKVGEGASRHGEVFRDTVLLTRSRRRFVLLPVPRH